MFFLFAVCSPALSYELLIAVVVVVVCVVKAFASYLCCLYFLCDLLGCALFVQMIVVVFPCYLVLDVSISLC